MEVDDLDDIHPNDVMVTISWAEIPLLPKQMVLDECERMQSTEDEGYLTGYEYAIASLLKSFAHVLSGGELE